MDIVAHQHIFSLLVVLQCHLMDLATDAGFLIAAKGSMGGVRVLAVHPYATGPKISFWSTGLSLLQALERTRNNP